MMILCTIIGVYQINNIDYYTIGVEKYQWVREYPNTYYTLSLEPQNANTNMMRNYDNQTKIDSIQIRNNEKFPIKVKVELNPINQNNIEFPINKQKLVEWDVKPVYNHINEILYPNIILIVLSNSIGMLFLLKPKLNTIYSNTLKKPDNQ